VNKFYQLEPNEWLVVCKELKPAELKVLYRLRTLDPFGQHPIKFRVIDLAKDLDINKGTVSRAVQRLAELDYINLEIVEAIATLTTKSKRLSTDNLVVSTQLSCLQTTSAIATQPDTPQSGSGQGSVFSKISLEDLRRSDRSNDFDFSENSQFPKHLEAIASCTDEAIEKCDLNRVDEDEDTKSPAKVINPIDGDSPRRALEDFILKSLQVSPSNRTAYFARFTTADWEKWKAKFKPPASPPPPPLFVPEIVKVAPPDVALANLAKIREMLKRGKK
jgi:DNA-binding MarR family transcriptional regulator